MTSVEKNKEERNDQTEKMKTENRNKIGSGKKITKQKGKENKMKKKHATQNNAHEDQNKIGNT